MLLLILEATVVIYLEIAKKKKNPEKRKSYVSSLILHHILTFNFSE